MDMGSWIDPSFGQCNMMPSDFSNYNSFNNFACNSMNMGYGMMDDQTHAAQHTMEKSISDKIPSSDLYPPKIRPMGPPRMRARGGKKSPAERDYRLGQPSNYSKFSNNSYEEDTFSGIVTEDLRLNYSPIDKRTGRLVNRDWKHRYPTQCTTRQETLKASQNNLPAKKSQNISSVIISQTSSLELGKYEGPVVKVTNLTPIDESPSNQEVPKINCSFSSNLQVNRNPAVNKTNSVITAKSDLSRKHMPENVRVLIPSYSEPIDGTAYNMETDQSSKVTESDVKSFIQTLRDMVEQYNYTIDEQAVEENQLGQRAVRFKIVPKKDKLSQESLHKKTQSVEQMKAEKELEASSPRMTVNSKVEKLRSILEMAGDNPTLRLSNRPKDSECDYEIQLQSETEPTNVIPEKAEKEIEERWNKRRISLKHSNYRVSKSTHIIEVISPAMNNYSTDEQCSKNEYFMPIESSMTETEAINNFPAECINDSVKFSEDGVSQLSDNCYLAKHLKTLGINKQTCDPKGGRRQNSYITVNHDATSDSYTVGIAPKNVEFQHELNQRIKNQFDEKNECQKKSMRPKTCERTPECGRKREKSQHRQKSHQCEKTDRHEKSGGNRDKSRLREKSCHRDKSKMHEKKRNNEKDADRIRMKSGGEKPRIRDKSWIRGVSQERKGESKKKRDKSRLRDKSTVRDKSKCRSMSMKTARVEKCVHDDICDCTRHTGCGDDFDYDDDDSHDQNASQHAPKERPWSILDPLTNKYTLRLMKYRNKKSGHPRLVLKRSRIRGGRDMKPRRNGIGNGNPLFLSTRVTSAMDAHRYPKIVGRAIKKKIVKSDMSMCKHDILMNTTPFIDTTVRPGSSCDPGITYYPYIYSTPPVNQCDPSGMGCNVPTSMCDPSCNPCGVDMYWPSPTCDCGFQSKPMRMRQLQMKPIEYDCIPSCSDPRMARRMKKNCSKIHILKCRSKCKDLKKFKGAKKNCSIGSLSLSGRKKSRCNLPNRVISDTSFSCLSTQSSCRIVPRRKILGLYDNIWSGLKRKFFRRGCSCRRLSGGGNGPHEIIECETFPDNQESKTVSTPNKKKRKFYFIRKKQCRSESSFQTPEPRAQILYKKEDFNNDKQDRLDGWSVEPHQKDSALSSPDGSKVIVCKNIIKRKHKTKSQDCTTSGSDVKNLDLTKLKHYFFRQDTQNLKAISRAVAAKIEEQERQSPRDYSTVTSDEHEIARQTRKQKQRSIEPIQLSEESKTNRPKSKPSNPTKSSTVGMSVADRVLQNMQFLEAQMKYINEAMQNRRSVCCSDERPILNINSNEPSLFDSNHTLETRQPDDTSLTNITTEDQTNISEITEKELKRLNDAVKTISENSEEMNNFMENKSHEDMPKLISDEQSNNKDDEDALVTARLSGGGMVGHSHDTIAVRISRTQPNLSPPKVNPIKSSLKSCLVNSCKSHQSINQSDKESCGHCHHHDQRSEQLGTSRSASFPKKVTIDDEPIELPRIRSGCQFGYCPMCLCCPCICKISHSINSGSYNIHVSSNNSNNSYCSAMHSNAIHTSTTHNMQGEKCSCGKMKVGKKQSGAMPSMSMPSINKSFCPCNVNCYADKIIDVQSYCPSSICICPPSPCICDEMDCALYQAYHDLVNPDIRAARTRSNFQKLIEIFPIKDSIIEASPCKMCSPTNVVPPLLPTSDFSQTDRKSRVTLYKKPFPTSEVIPSDINLNKLAAVPADKEDLPNVYCSDSGLVMLDYKKILRYLNTSYPSNKLKLLQALRWRLTRTPCEVRDAVLREYIRNDILGIQCTCGSSHLWEKLLWPLGVVTPHPIQNCIARFMNAILSSKYGRDYVGSRSVIKGLVFGETSNGQRFNHCSGPHEREIIDAHTSDMLIACMMKLSLNPVQRRDMVQKGLLKWVASHLEDVEFCGTKYHLEYAMALLMVLVTYPHACEVAAHNSKQMLAVLARYLYKEDLPNCKAYARAILLTLFRHHKLACDARSMNFGQILLNRLKFTVDQVESKELQAVYICLHAANSASPQFYNKCINEYAAEGDYMDCEIDVRDPILEVDDPSGEELLCERFAVHQTRKIRFPSRSRAVVPADCLVSKKHLIPRILNKIHLDLKDIAQYQFAYNIRKNCKPCKFQRMKAPKRREMNRRTQNYYRCLYDRYTKCDKVIDDPEVIPRHMKTVYGIYTGEKERQEVALVKTIMQNREKSRSKKKHSVLSMKNSTFQSKTSLQNRARERRMLRAVGHRISAGGVSVAEAEKIRREKDENNQASGLFGTNMINNNDTVTFNKTTNRIEIKVTPCNDGRTKLTYEEDQFEVVDQKRLRSGNSLFAYDKSETTSPDRSCCSRLSNRHQSKGRFQHMSNLSDQLSAKLMHSRSRPLEHKNYDPKLMDNKNLRKFDFKQQKFRDYKDKLRKGCCRKNAAACMHLIDSSSDGKRTPINHEYMSLLSRTKLMECLEWNSEDPCDETSHDASVLCFSQTNTVQDKYEENDFPSVENNVDNTFDSTYDNTSNNNTINNDSFKEVSSEPVNLKVRHDSDQEQRHENESDIFGRPCTHQTYAVPYKYDLPKPKHNEYLTVVHESESNIDPPSISQRTTDSKDSRPSDIIKHIKKPAGSRLREQIKLLGKKGDYIVERIEKIRTSRSSNDSKPLGHKSKEISTEYFKQLDRHKDLILESIEKIRVKPKHKERKRLESFTEKFHKDWPKLDKSDGGFKINNTEGHWLRMKPGELKTCSKPAHRGVHDLDADSDFNSSIKHPVQRKRSNRFGSLNDIRSHLLNSASIRHRFKEENFFHLGQCRSKHKRQFRAFRGQNNILECLNEEDSQPRLKSGQDKFHQIKKVLRNDNVLMEAIEDINGSFRGTVTQTINTAEVIPEEFKDHRDGTRKKDVEIEVFTSKKKKPRQLPN